MENMRGLEPYILGEVGLDPAFVFRPHEFKDDKESSMGLTNCKRAAFLVLERPSKNSPFAFVVRDESCGTDSVEKNYLEDVVLLHDDFVPEECRSRLVVFNVGCKASSSQVD